MGKKYSKSHNTRGCLSAIKDRRHSFQRIGVLGTVDRRLKKITYRQVIALVASSNRVKLETQNLPSTSVFPNRQIITEENEVFEKG